MDTINPQSIIAHRGAWKDFNFAQNSVAAFLKAQELPIGGIEFDLQYTKDGRIIVYHDDSFRGNYISQKRYVQLRGYQIFKKDSILTFKKLLRYWEGKKILWIELKPSNLNGFQKKEFAKKTLNTLNGRTSNIHFISFDLSILKEIIRYSNVPCSYLGDEYSLVKLRKNGIYGVDVEFSRFFDEESLLSEAKQLGMNTNAWTVNSLEKAKLLLNKGVDYLTTDELQLMLKN